MAKGDGSKHAQARVNFLQRAAGYLTTQSGILGETRLAELNSKTNADASNRLDQSSEKQFRQTTAARQAQVLNAQCRAVARKTQTRLSKDAKRSMCKKCDATLIAGQTSEEFVENKSRRRSKPWADVKVVKCLACATTKRFPVGMKRQPKKAHRGGLKEEAHSKTDKSESKAMAMTKK